MQNTIKSCRCITQYCLDLFFLAFRPAKMFEKEKVAGSH